MSLDPVRDFYTSHPYPPAAGDLERYRQAWQAPNRSRAEYHLLWPESAYREDLDILVAGCGTSQAARYALCRPAARVVGIDVSSTSLEETDRLKRQYNLTNLHAHELSIERVGELQTNFDLIVCTGVLHHLADPDAGLRALASVLRPGGAIHLMVYAPYGRAGIYLLQDYCRRLGVGTAAEEIADLVAVLATLPPRHPLTPLLRESRDFAHADAIADALLNPRDRSYSVPQLFEFIERNGLAFGRWYQQAPYRPQCGAIAATPHMTRLALLPVPEQYAALELWRGTISRHSVIAYRRGTPEVPLTVGLDGERWPHYVPLRLPQTICVQERLPAGAAGVLLNRSHEHHDLIMPVGAQEKRMFDAIDGRRPIEAIIRQAGGSDVHERARAFFEKLWWYDQVSFDASNAARSLD